VESVITITGDRNLLDTCRIAGVLLDNAMEACHEVEDGVVRLMGDMLGDSAFFVFQNTCHVPPPIREINQKGFSTKEGFRGLGLYNISQLMSRNGNILLKTNVKDGYFTQELRIAPKRP